MRSHRALIKLVFRILVTTELSINFKRPCSCYEVLLCMYIKELKTEELLNMTQINPELLCHPQILLPHMPLWDLFRELKLNKSWPVSHNNSFYDYGQWRSQPDFWSCYANISVFIDRENNDHKFA